MPAVVLVLDHRLLKASPPPAPALAPEEEPDVGLAAEKDGVDVRPGLGAPAPPCPGTPAAAG